VEHQPKQRDADRSRGAILDAAETLFAAHGFEAVTMARVGAAAGVSRGTPGYFFGSKEALYRTVVERAAATVRMLAETLKVRAAASDRDRAVVLADTVDAFLALLTSRRSIVALLDQTAAAMEVQPHAEALRDALSSLGPDADRAALTVLAMCWFPLSHPDAARVLGLDPDAPEFARLCRERVLAAVGAAPDSPPTRSAPAAAVAHEPAAPIPGAAPAPKKKKKKKKKG
jgi:TetR/AcrR family transcriptional regulator